jgi:hypothetical protein
LEKNLEFVVSSGLTLSLNNLWAIVNIRPGKLNLATVCLSGDEKLLKDILVNQPSPDQLNIEGQGRVGGVTVIQTGRRSSISISNIRGGSIVVGGGTVIVNGKVISGGENIIENEGIEMPSITITAPEGTALDADSVESLISKGLNGKLYLSVTGQGNANVQGISSGKVDCIGQSRARISDVQGDLKLSCRGQSDINAKGNFGNIDADSSGQSRITIIGNCNDCNADTSGQSSISLIGHASGKVRRHESGMSSIDIE